MKTKFVLLIALMVAFLGLAPSCFAAGKGVTLVVDARNLDNEYFQLVFKGAKIFAEHVGQPIITTVYDSSNEKEVSDLKSIIARTGRDAVFCLFPNEEPVVKPLADICEAAGVYFVTFWNKPPSLNVWDYKYWVAHITADNVETGYLTGKSLCEAIGEKGNVAALQGRLAATNGQQRFEGFKKALAEYPNVKLLDAQTGRWERSFSMSVTESWLVKYPQGVNGIWAANDEMALGAVEALRGAGLVGKAAVTGVDATGDAIRGLLAGEMLSTVAVDPIWAGGMGLSLAYHAYKGDLKLKDLPKGKRAFYNKQILITQNNAADFKMNYIVGIPKINWDDLWANYAGPIRPGE